MTRTSASPRRSAPRSTGNQARIQRSSWSRRSRRRRARCAPSKRRSRLTRSSSSSSRLRCPGRMRRWMRRRCVHAPPELPLTSPSRLLQPRPPARPPGTTPGARHSAWPSPGRPALRRRTLGERPSRIIEVCNCATSRLSSQAAGAEAPPRGGNLHGASGDLS